MPKWESQQWADGSSGLVGGSKAPGRLKRRRGLMRRPMAVMLEKKTPAERCDAERDSTLTGGTGSSSGSALRQAARGCSLEG